MMHTIEQNKNKRHANESGLCIFTAFKKLKNEVNKMIGQDTFLSNLEYIANL